MRLFANTTSPFVRLVRLAIAEKGLSDQIEVEIVDPWADPAHFLAANPAGRVPTLVTDDGHAIAEAHLILRYLESLAGPSIYPEDDLAETLSSAGQRLARSKRPLRLSLGASPAIILTRIW